MIPESDETKDGLFEMYGPEGELHKRRTCVSSEATPIYWARSAVRKFTKFGCDTVAIFGAGAQISTAVYAAERLNEIPDINYSRIATRTEKIDGYDVSAIIIELIYSGEPERCIR